MFFYIVMIGIVCGSFTGKCVAENDIIPMGTNPPEQIQAEPFDQEVTQEMIDQEEEWLERKIKEINERPVKEFGSLVLKRKKRAYYADRLRLLHTSPKQYFQTKTDKLP
jgi:hypothetical protein